MPEARRKREISEPRTEIPRSEEQKVQRVPALLTSVVAKVCSVMSASGVVIAVLDSQGIRCLASTGEAPPIGARLQPHSSLSAECFKTGKAVLRDEAKSDSRIPPSLDGSLPVRSAVAVPILAEGSIVGTIEVFSSEPSATYAADIAPLEGIADLVAPIVAPASVFAQPGTGGSTVGAIQKETPSFAEQRPGVQQSVTKNAEHLVDSPSPAVEQRSASSGAAPSVVKQFVGKTTTAGARVADRAASMLHWLAVFAQPGTGGSTVGAIQTETPSEQRPGVQQSVTKNAEHLVDSPSPAVEQGSASFGAAPSVVKQFVGKTATAGARVADRAASMLHWLAESAVANRWLAVGTPLLILAFVLLFVGFRAKVSKTSSGSSVPPAAGWASGDDSARPVENEARSRVEVQGHKDLERSSRPGAALPSAPQPLAKSEQGSRGKVRAAKAGSSPLAPVEPIKVVASRSTDGPHLPTQDSKSLASAGHEQLANPGSSALAVEEAKLEPPELAAKAPVLELAPSVTSPIEPAAISRPDFVLDHTLKGHSGWVTGVAFSSDGRRLASGSWDQTVKLWDVPTGKELNVVGSKMMEVQALAFSRDGHWLAVENSNNTVTLWDATTETKIHTLPSNKPLAPLGKNWVYSIAFSPDGRWLASGVDDKTVRIWDVRSGRAVRDLTGLRRSVIYAAFSPDGRWLASGDDDKSIRIWEVSTGKEIRRLTGHKKPIYAVAFSPNGRWLASASADKTIKLWDIEAGREVQTLTGHGSQVTSVSFSPDGRWLASGSRDKTIKIWDVETGHELQTLGAHDHSIYTVAFDSRGRWLASGSEDGTINLWRLSEAVDRTSLR